jgi:hypothetical protein
MKVNNKFLVFVFLCLAWWFPAGPAQGQGFGVGNYQVLSSTRVGRTEFEYTLSVTISNQVATAFGVTAQVYSVSTNTEVVQGEVSFGDVLLGATAVSSNTITIRQNRVAPFNPADLQWFVTVQSMPLSLAVTSPVSGFLTNGTNVTVSGSFGDAVDGVTIGHSPATISGNNFSGTFALEEGRNTISVLASNQFGGSGLVNVVVTRDTTPPILTIETPTNGTVLAKRQVTISGLVNDAVPGTVNPEQATVMVNGLSALILNRSFSISDVLLVPGTNTVTVVARDRAGNESQRQIQLIYIDPASQKHLVQLAGDEQFGVVGTLLPQPLLVELVDGDGVIQTNQPVTFAVTRNDGILFASPDSGRTLTVQTDDKGQARVLLQLGTRTGVGNNQVMVTSPGVNGQMLFEASGVGALPAKISPLIPETQVGEIGKPLPQPWTAYATDSGGNPVAGAPISFTVSEGGGNLDGATTVSTNTDSDGRASVILTLGPDEGINNNVVLAESPGVTNSSAVFTASGQTPGAIDATRVTGLVLDNANHPMSNVLCVIANTARAAVTDEQGQFVISGAPVGAIRLIVDAQNRGYPGEWHALTFNLVTVAGRDTSLDRPIYMLQVDSDSAAMAGGDKDVTLRLKDFPGATLTVFAHSLRNDQGQPITNRVTWTQVNAERIPMSPPQGSQPILTTAILPAGMRFDPPAKMCIPNSGLPPGQILELYGFDHDIGSFVSVGTATVSSDGSMICSDPGFGIVKSGWHPFVPPPPPCTPVCSGPPADTDCTHYTTIPPASRCDCPTYVPKQAEVKKVKALANGSNPADTIAVGNAVSFSANVDQTCFNGVSYHWTFGDPAGSSSDSASPSFTYTNQGTFTATVVAKCTGCESAAGSDSVQITVTNNCVLKIRDETHGRGSVNGVLEVANSLPSSLGDQITASVQQAGGGSSSPVNWTVTDSDGTVNINKNAVSVQFKASPPAIQVPILVVDIVPDVYTVTEDCGNGSSGTVTAYSDVKNGIDIDMAKFGDMADQINLVLGLALGGGMGAIDKPNGKASFENQWKECPTSNKAYWTYKVSAGLNPLIGANYTQYFGPSAFVPSWLQDYVVGGFFAKIEGSINLNGVISSDECNVFQGGIELTGKVGLSIGARAYAAGIVDITIKGGAEIVASGKLVYQQKAIHAQGQIGWSGITASVSVKALAGWVQFNREWVVYAGNDKWLDGDTVLYNF